MTIACWLLFVGNVLFFVQSSHKEYVRRVEGVADESGLVCTLLLNSLWAMLMCPFRERENATYYKRDTRSLADETSVNETLCLNFIAFFKSPASWVQFQISFSLVTKILLCFLQTLKFFHLEIIIYISIIPSTDVRLRDGFTTNSLSL